MKAVCLLSGGMDSSTLAYVAKDMGYDIIALHFTYGQRTEAKERECARTIARALDAQEFVEISLEHFKKIGASSLTDAAIPVEKYSGEEEGIPSTYVPFRNGNLLAIATSLAEARRAAAVFIGVQTGDYPGYPDCRPEFIEAFQRVVDLGTAADPRITLMTPFVRMTKTEIIQRGMALGVPYEHTWSCYQNNDRACGVCSSCHYRREAFRDLGLEDPIEYER
ncbi:MULTISPECIES: 7-cyano-7-deazaguanine synthase QueC [unclassified Methanoculleus]|uniref:7-cyano-7-deazaguanine synthase n=1 Tax=Methanoculleus palmolei TaxID=72612 RepID=A0ABD8ABR8_9EURY|nr:MULTISPECIES: 7-cyano-7-deazaguanine synthase QueC [unclassified Methanoculleus]MDD2472871.1 7-cyano-7-deazaguanine synthase QueC [Methanoculleus sp.]WOX56690.1 7-cyano-7-deazaguanine synthase QueC [Methanoculleus palmolei]